MYHEKIKVPRAVFSWTIEADGTVVAIIDHFRAKLPTRTVTNDAEDVLADIVEKGALKPGMRVIYRDTDRIWDEIVIDGACRFVEFSPIGAVTHEEAIARLDNRDPAADVRVKR